MTVRQLRLYATLVDYELRELCATRWPVRWGVLNLDFEVERDGDVYCIAFYESDSSTEIILHSKLLDEDIPLRKVKAGDIVTIHLKDHFWHTPALRRFKQVLEKSE